MRNAAFLRINDGNTMRNTTLQFIFHSIILLIYKQIPYNL
ncbi:hypothetical protein HMPREF2532_02951 [Bacteroides ovatus]|nr:hypothetical protein HMPREF2532_02951 [Bacteroides ovatus]